MPCGITSFTTGQSQLSCHEDTHHVKPSVPDVHGRGLDVVLLEPRPAPMPILHEQSSSFEQFLLPFGCFCGKLLLDQKETLPGCRDLVASVAGRLREILSRRCGTRLRHCMSLPSCRPGGQSVAMERSTRHVCKRFVGHYSPRLSDGSAC